MNTLPHPVPRIFISHSSMDDAFGHRITQDLRREFGDDTVVWYDSQGSLRGGDTWLRKIERGITECDVFVVVLSPSAMESPWVNNEIDMALIQRKHIIPLRYKACSVRPSLQPMQAISFLPPHTYETGFNELCAVLGVTGPAFTDTVISTATSTFSPTVSSSPLAGWHKIFSQLAPTCDNQNGIGWTKGPGDFTCRPEGLAMQQTSETFAELDLTQVNGKAFNLTTFGVKVTASFQDPTDPFTYASLFVQIPRTADGIGGYVFDLSTYGGRGWDLYQVKSAKAVQGLDSSSAVHGALGASNGPITMIAIVHIGEFSVYINNQSEPLFRQHLTFNPSPGNFGLMTWKFGSTSSSIVYFSNFELYEPK